MPVSPLPLSPSASERGGDAEDDDDIVFALNDSELKVSGFIRNNRVTDVVSWDPCIMVVKQNIFTVYLGSISDDAACCTMEVCHVAPWAQQSLGEVLPVEGLCFASSGVLAGTSVYETLVCSALDAHGTW